jgi:hypothetical protein
MTGRPRKYLDDTPDRKKVWEIHNPPPPERLRYKAEWARAYRRRLRESLPGSEREAPEHPDYPVAEDPPMTCPHCQWWVAKNDNAGQCGLQNEVTTRVDSCNNFVEILGEF